MVAFGKPTQITYLSDGLKLIQTGSDAGHFAISAAHSETAMSEYLALLGKVKL